MTECHGPLALLGHLVEMAGLRRQSADQRVPGTASGVSEYYLPQVGIPGGWAATLTVMVRQVVGAIPCKWQQLLCDPTNTCGLLVACLIQQGGSVSRYLAAQKAINCKANRRVCRARMRFLRRGLFDG